MTSLRLLAAMVFILLTTSCGGGTTSLPRMTGSGHSQSDATVQNAVAAPQAAGAPAAVSCVAGGACSLNINAGGAAIPNWDKDEDDSGPSYTYATNAPIITSGVTMPAPQAVYQSQRVATGALKHTITYGSAPLGAFQVSLHFAEIYFATAGKRVFNVSINGTRVLSNFDVEAVAGGKFHALVKTFTGSTTTNSIVVEFTSVTNYPIINGLQIQWAESPTYQSLYSFKGGADGASPYAGLLEVGGILYGTTANGGGTDPNGSARNGTVYAITPSGVEHVVYSFQYNPQGPPPNIVDGGDPQAALIDVNGSLYGTAVAFGANENQGTVFMVSTSGAESVLWNFGGPDGANPAARLIDVDGVLYGTTSGGGNGGMGTVFALTTSGSERVVYRFNGGTDGANPMGDLIDVNGTLYGTTRAGGTSGNGTVFAVSTSGTERVLYRFKGGTDGSNPDAGLIAVNGVLYGTTRSGGGAPCPEEGQDACGTVFELSTSGTERVLHSFTGRTRQGGTDGANPDAGLVAVNGVLYGTTTGGGASGDGTVFELSTSGTERILYSFKGGTDGAAPVAGLTYVNGVLYGTTAYGGATCTAFGTCGTVFKLTL